MDSPMGGLHGITWQELAAWQLATATFLTGEESSLIVHLSKAYAGQHNKSSNTDEMNPLLSEQEKMELKLRARFAR